MSYPNCQELFLENVVGVRIYKASECSVPIPPTLPIESLSFSLPASAPVFQSHIAEIDGYATMSDHPTLKITNSRSAAGNVYTHDLQIPTQLGRKDAEQAVRQLQGYDFYVVYQKTDGSMSFSYSLPNSSVADIEENVSPSLSVSVKIKVQSMSPLINIM